MLDHETTMSLVIKAQNGDNEAKNLLLTHNSPLIKSVIKRFKNKAIEYDDLYQIGSIGFLKAINNFDLSYNVRFSTYCVPMIIGEVKRFLRDDGEIKVSRAIKSLNLQISKFIEEFKEKNEEPPTTKDIANHFDIDEAEVVFVMDSNKMPISLFTPINEPNSKTQLLIDKFDQDSHHEQIYDRVSLKNSLSSLDERDKQIVLLRFFKDKTQSEIADIMGISQVQVSRLENKILEKLKDKLN
ncbi:MAG: SigB/SigF/SigG family RNA polymerase sigma factor [Christensenellales bacterium]